MVAKKPPKYDPIGDVLSVETAFIQASHALDLVGDIALESKDTEQLMKVAAMYMELGSRLVIPGEESEEEEEEEHDLSATTIGFSPIELPKPAKEAAQEDGRTNRDKAQAQGRGQPRLHPKYGQLRITKTRY